MDTATMATEIPTTMRALVTTKYCTPDEYIVGTIPVPKITQPDEILVKVHAAGVNPIDVKMASSLGKMMSTSTFPRTIGYDLSGTIISVGTSVTKFHPGDAIYSRIPSPLRGSISQFALTTESTTAFKPSSLSFIQAAALPLAGLTALEAFELAEETLEGGLNGKTVFVPAGLSGTGSFGVQLAGIFGAGKIITSLSTGKIERFKEEFGEDDGVEIVDYTKEDVKAKIGKEKVDFMFDIVGSSVQEVGIMRKGGVVVSISLVPSGEMMKREEPELKSYLRWMLNAMDWAVRRWMGWWGVQYRYLYMTPSGEKLEKLGRWVQELKLKVVVGNVVELEDLEAVRKGCMQIYKGKGGVGKFVVKVL